MCSVFLMFCVVLGLTKVHYGNALDVIESFGDALQDVFSYIYDVIKEPIKRRNLRNARIRRTTTKVYKEHMITIKTTSTVLPTTTNAPTTKTYVAGVQVPILQKPFWKNLAHWFMMQMPSFVNPEQLQDLKFTTQRVTKKPKKKKYDEESNFGVLYFI